MIQSDRFVNVVRLGSTQFGSIRLRLPIVFFESFWVGTDTFSGYWRSAEQAAVLIPDRNDFHRRTQGQATGTFNQPAQQANAIVEVDDPDRKRGGFYEWRRHGADQG